MTSTKTNGRQHSAGGVHKMIDTRLVPGVVIALVIALIVRGSYVWTAGAVDLFVVPILGGLLSVLVGLSIAGCVELLMGVAGREWLHYRRVRAAILARRDMRPAERNAEAERLAGMVRLSFWFMVIGAVASLFSGVWFLLSLAPSGGLAGAVIDCGVTVIATASFLYFGALREDTGTDPAERLEAEANRALLQMVEGAASMLADMRGGEITPGVFARLIGDALPPQVRAKFAPVVAQLAPPDAAVVWWEVGQLYTYAGATGEGDKRRVRHRLRALYDRGTDGVRKDARGAWLITAHVAREHFADDHDAAILRTAHAASASSGAPIGAPILAPALAETTPAARRHVPQSV